MTTRMSLVCATLVGGALAAQAPAEEQFTVIGIPDTQFYSESFPQIFLAQTQWVADNVEALNIRFVSHYGDVVQHGNDIEEWDNAEVALDVLDFIDIPWGVSAGNHDVTPSGGDASGYIPQFFRDRYGPTHWVDDDFVIGVSPSGMSNAQVFSGGGREWLVLHIECDLPVRELAWAQGVLDQHRDKACIVTTHRWLQDAEDYTGGVPVVPSGRYPAIWYTIEDVHTQGGIQSEQAWRWFMRKNPSIFLINCGHFHEEYRQTSTNVAGLPVHEVLADYQDDPNGGNGWLRIMTFNVDTNQIQFDSYSPTLDQIRTAAESQFALAVQFDSYRLPPGQAFRAFQEGINNYFGTADTWVDEDNPNTSYGNDSTRVSDDDTDNNFFADYRGHALIKFTGMFSESGHNGTIPYGSQIEDAWLTIEIADDVDFTFNPVFYVYEMLTSWSESSTWNSLNNGVNGGDIGELMGAFLGDNVPDGDETRRVNVTSLVQRWANGQPNHGVAILPEIISGNDDGIEIYASESGNEIRRPRLDVRFSSPYAACPADCVPDNGDGSYGNGVVNIDDVLAVINALGTGGGRCDFVPENGDGTFGNGVVNIDDLLGTLNAFGLCP